MQRPKSINVIAICIFRNVNQILVFEAFDAIKGKPYYRPLGGGVEPGETSKEAIIREIREEIGQEIKEVKRLGVLETMFVHEGKAAHEIVFVYDASFEDKSAYEQAAFTVREDNGEILNAVWKELTFFNDYHQLVPLELRSLLESSTKEA
jgi:8-oxo-dGTP pyrophosphatase MutT (NUDIX family)